MKLITLVLSLVSAASAASYTIETSSTCEIITTHPVTYSRLPYYTDACSAEGADGTLVIAGGDAVVTLPEPGDIGSVPSAGLSIGVLLQLVDVDPDEEVLEILHEGIRASVYGKITMFLATTGPVRPGVLHTGGRRDPEGTGELSSPWENFQLGTPFEMSLEVSVERAIFAVDQYPSLPQDLMWSGYGAIAFHEPRVYEADGITPVQVYWADEAPVHSPEPSTYALAGIGIAGLIVSRWRRAH